MTAFDRFFHGPHAAIRPYLITRIVPAVLALDIWILMIGHAGRYGIADFNVAHFALLDRLLPVPTAAGYIATLVFAGMLALVVALTGIRLATTLSLFVCYSLSWAISMLDSYQHHYFLSLVLLCLPAFARVSADDLRDDQGAAANVTGFGYPLLACTIAIVYAYAALAKCDPLWVDGYTIQRISNASERVAPLIGTASTFGLSRQQAWSIASTAVIPLEMLLGLFYLVACQQERVKRRWLHAASLAAAGLAFMLHAGAETMELEIGWFSYYMMLFAVVYLLPARVLLRLATPLAWLEQRITAQVRELEREAERATYPTTTLMMALGAAGLLGFAGYNVNLPGALPACALGAAAVLGWTFYLASRGRIQQATSPILASLAAAFVMWLAITQSDVRWDFYRYLGGDLSRRGQAAEALTVYLTGEQYAPEGESRRDKIERLKRRVGQLPR